MSNDELCSAVFILRPTRYLPAQVRFLGRMAQKLAFAMMNKTGYVDEAEVLHNMKGALPYTIGDILAFDKQRVWFRITGLNTEIGRIITGMVTGLVGQEIALDPRDSADEQVWTAAIEDATLTAHEWAGVGHYQSLMQQVWFLQPQKHLRLGFHSPTAIKSVGIFRPFPQPALIFRLLYERWQKLDAPALPFQPEVSFLENFADYFIEIKDYQLACKSIPQKNIPITTFSGWADYHFRKENKDFQKRAETHAAKYQNHALMAAFEDIQAHWQDYVTLVQFLGVFAFYSGLGSYTGQGMGMVRPLANSSR